MSEEVKKRRRAERFGLPFHPSPTELTNPSGSLGKRRSVTHPPLSHAPAELCGQCVTAQGVSSPPLKHPRTSTPSSSPTITHNPAHEFSHVLWIYPNEESLPLPRRERRRRAGEEAFHAMVIAEREPEELVIDGGQGEGGGQVFRLALSLSCMRKQLVRIHSIRKSRKRPGLEAQHLACVHVLSAVCGAVCQGAEIHSTTVSVVRFDERVLEAHSHSGGCTLTYDIGTAGSITLVLQALLPLTTQLPFTLRVQLKGGTNVPFSPPIQHTQRVLLPILASMGIHTEINTRAFGFYPLGGGCVEFISSGNAPNIQPIVLTEVGQVTKVVVCTCVCGPSHLCTSISLAVERVCAEMFPAVDAVFEPPAHSTRYEHKKQWTWGMQCIAYTSTGCILCADSLKPVAGSSPLEMTREVFGQLHLRIQKKSCVDVHTLDQLVCFMACASGPSRVRCLLSDVQDDCSHVRTAMEVCTKITGVPFRIEEDQDTCILQCDGLNYD